MPCLRFPNAIDDKLYTAEYRCGKQNKDSLKKSTKKEYASKIEEYLNPYVIISYAIFFGATLCTVIAYKKVDLSFGPILGTTEYIFVAVLSRLVLKEHISIKKIIGLGVIIAGIVVYAL